ncbi:MAG: TolC family protein [Bacteroidales bacterium]|nr:TolC family protein [Bacteroidales bacterium]
MKNASKKTYALVCSVVLILMSGTSLMAQNKTWTLKECIDYAVEKNIQLNETRLSSQADQLNYKQAKSNQYPDLSLSSQQSWSFSNPKSSSGTSSGSQNSVSANNVSLGTNVMLFGGFQLKNEIKQYKELYDASKYDIEKVKNDITLSVLADYLQVIYSYKAVEIAKSQISSTMTQVDMTQKLVRAGSIPEGNLLQIQSQLATDKGTLVNYQNQLQVAKLALMQLMRMPAIGNFEVDTTGVEESTVLDSTMSSHEIYNISQGIMPEIKSAELNLQANETGIKVAKSSLYPRLSLSAALKTGYSSSSALYSYINRTEAIGYLQSDPTQMVMSNISTAQKENYPVGQQLSDNFGQLVGLSLTIPIFSNNQGKYGVERAKIALQNAKLAQQSTKDQLRMSVEQANTDLIAAIKNYAAAEDILKSARRSYTDMSKKYNTGFASATDYIVQKNNYEQAQFGLNQARFNYIFKSKIVDFYLGKFFNK